MTDSSSKKRKHAEMLDAQDILTVENAAEIMQHYSTHHFKSHAVCEYGVKAVNNYQTRTVFNCVMTLKDGKSSTSGYWVSKKEAKNEAAFLLAKLLKGDLQLPQHLYESVTKKKKTQ